MNTQSHAPARKRLALGLLLLAALGMGVALLMLLRSPAPQPIEILPPATAAVQAATATQPPPTPTAAATPRPLRVDVAGAVVAPGVYRLPPDSIVADAIAAAGGSAPDADLDRINKAVALADGMQVYVPHLAQPTPELLTPALPPPPPAQRAPAAPPAGPGVDVNTASQAELEALPGIGPSLAQRIIAGRPYERPEDLLEVKGIGPVVFEKLRALVRVR